MRGVHSCLCNQAACIAPLRTTLTGRRRSGVPALACKVLTVQDSQSSLERTTCCCHLDKFASCPAVTFTVGTIDQRHYAACIVSRYSRGSKQGAMARSLAVLSHCRYPACSFPCFVPQTSHFGTCSVLMALPASEIRATSRNYCANHKAGAPL
jgi:hypothetical protein